VENHKSGDKSFYKFAVERSAPSNLVLVPVMSILTFRRPYGSLGSFTPVNPTIKHFYKFTYYGYFFFPAAAPPSSVAAR
jgi:hypothetical protein